jgi:two-component system cell cycle response regulator
MGGEEFLVVLPGLDDGEALARLQDLRALVADQCWQDVTPGRPVTVSIGAVSVPEDGDDMSQILRRADRNLYVAKRAGRDRVVFGPQHADVP